MLLWFLRTYHVNTDSSRGLYYLFGSFEFQVGKQLAFTLEKSSFPVNK